MAECWVRALAAAAEETGRSPETAPDSIFERFASLPREGLDLALRAGGAEACLALLRRPGADPDHRDLVRLLLRHPDRTNDICEAYRTAVGDLDTGDLEALGAAGAWSRLLLEFTRRPPRGRDERYLRAVALARTGRYAEARGAFEDLRPRGYRDTALWLRFIDKLKDSGDTGGSDG